MNQERALKIISKAYGELLNKRCISAPTLEELQVVINFSYMWLDADGEQNGY